MNQVKNELNEIRSLGNEEVNVLIFELKSALKIVSISCAIGLVIGTLAFIKTPDRYEATSILSLSQTLDLSVSRSNIFRGVSIQDSSLLILELRDEILTSEILSECVDQNKSEKSIYRTSDLFVISPVKNADYLIEVKNLIKSPNHATRCLESFIDNLINMQYAVQKEYISQLEKMLEFKHDELKEIKKDNFGKEATKPNELSFLPINSQIQKIITEIGQIKNSINYANENGPKYFTKPKILKSPPTNNRANKILGGFFGGALLGILIIFGRKAVYRLMKTKN